MRKKLNKYIKRFYSFALINRQFLSFILLLTIECGLLVGMTLGVNSIKLNAFCLNLSIIIILGGIGYLFKPKNQYKYFQIVLSFLTIICLINAIYYTFYNSFVTVSLIESLGQVETVTNAVFDKLNVWHAIYLLFPISLLIIHKKLISTDYFDRVDELEDSHKNFTTVTLIGIVLLGLNLLTLTPTDVSRLEKQWNREYIVERYGIILYQLNDLTQSAQSRIFSYFGYDAALLNFNTFYESKDNTKRTNEYTDVYKGKNLVFIHMESMMTMFVDLKINGEEVTPTLNKLTREGLYFKNFYPQISVGTSSDTEFTLNTSLMPSLVGTVFVNYFDRDYPSLEKILKDMDYYTFSMHANSSSMWNRKAMHASLGYDDFYSKEYFDVTEKNTIGLGLSDHEFFLQAIPYLKSIENEHKKYMGTMITLTNHTPWDAGDAYGEFDLTRVVSKENEETGEVIEVIDPYLSDTRLGNYIRSVHYSDAALGEFIEYLYEENLFDDTVVVFYGDHDAKLAQKEYAYLYNYSPELGRMLEEDDEGYVLYDYYANELNKNTPLIIWTKDNKYKGTIDYYMGMIDVLPTIGNMMGFSSKYALGHDIFDIKNNNIIVFPNGNFLTENVYFNNSRGEYKILKDSLIIDESYIQDSKTYAEEILEISNDIILYDLIGNGEMKNEK